ncbi:MULTISPECIES: hypothetical protein [Streptomyces]|uniref:hypothetical protein n=1 Tax=Streptomyces TaxID=1883 RepID=UPI001E374784|nr:MULTISPECIES: hypothetical protein [Streptomyces]UFQ19935.1 hypothetical protein J2N69_36015 [Streptomyces huasconensis]WCL89557.1 hypothetical protein PPN52_35955 [Streptomyces sp. JCM 35825]
MNTDTAQGPELVVQGKFANAPTRAACRQDSPPADDEGIVRIPLSMVEQIRRVSGFGMDNSQIAPGCRPDASAVAVRVAGLPRRWPSV